MADYADLLAAETNKTPGKKQSPAANAGQDTEHTANKPRRDDVSQDAHRDVITPLRHDFDYRAWRDVIENTETHNSALRLTREERYEVEDMISELERKHKIKTSMNEIARLGVLWVIHDFKKNRGQSLVYKVKKS
jgi:hypothetical protein